MAMMTLEMQRACHMLSSHDAIATRRHPTILLTVGPDAALSLDTLTHLWESNVETMLCGMQTCCVPNNHWVKEAAWRSNSTKTALISPNGSSKTVESCGETSLVGRCL